MSSYCVYELIPEAHFDPEDNFLDEHSYVEGASPSPGADWCKDSENYREDVEALYKEYPFRDLRFEKHTFEDGSVREFASFTVTGDLMVDLENRLKQVIKDTQYALDSARLQLADKTISAYSKIMGVSRAAGACWSSSGTRFHMEYTFNANRLMAKLEPFIGQKVYIGGIVRYHV